MTYVNAKTTEGIETIDEFETYREAKEMIKEYRMAYHGSGIDLWLSQRSTKEWREDK